MALKVKMMTRVMINLIPKKVILLLLMLMMIRRGHPVMRVMTDDVPQLAPEALFLVESRSRFARTVRFNGRYIQ